jgi:nucleoside 2-deoxyribosyltransferase
MNVYVASSWRNTVQPTIVTLLREDGHNVYDFRHPAPGERGFKWSDIEPDWQEWDARRFRHSLGHPIAEAGFAKDMAALVACDICVLVMPCGRSAHLEAGWAAGAGKRTIIYLTEGEPELMYKMATFIVTSPNELLTAISTRSSWGEPQA